MRRAMALYDEAEPYLERAQAVWQEIARERGKGR